MRAVEDAYKHNKAAIDTKLGGEVVFTALSGHVCRWLEPSEYDEWKDTKWKDLELPLTPEPFQIAGTKEEYASGVLANVKKLVKEEKPDAYIVGTDSDVEGNGIFYLLSKYLHIENKPTYRFFEQSLTEKEIVHSLLHMTDFYKEPRDVRMTDTFITRSQFDWLVGMNATIAITTRSGELYRVGRVKAPTIKLVYDNSMAIDNFVPHSDFFVKAEFADGFTGMMLTEDRSEEEVFETEDKAIAFIEALSDPKSANVVSLEKKKISQSAPALYKLSSLQGEAGSKYNYSPKQTLDTVQELYEMRLLTYPRTDGTFVSTAKAATFDTLINTMKHIPELSEHANKVSAADIEKVKKNKKVVNDEEVKKSSHDALLPTETIPSNFEKLSKMQQDIYLLVAKRFLAQFLPDKVNESTTLLSNISGRIFRSKGTITLLPGWSILYRKTSDEEEKEKDEKIPSSIEKGATISVNTVKPHEKVSKPPARLTSATLVTAMENIAKYIDDKHLKDVMKEAKGIGTQATRADIIEQLIKTGYIKCEGKKNTLSITDMGKRYMETMKQFSITDPTTAAEWESVFQSVKEGKVSREDAKEQTLDYVYDFIDEVAKAEIKVAPRDLQVLNVNCPFCKENGKIRKLKWGYACENAIGKEAACHFKLSNFDGKVTEKDIAALSTEGITRKITAISKSKKTGKAFNARLKLIGNTENGIQFAFDDPEELPVKCPYCQGKIFKYDWGYSCENRRSQACTFVVSNKRKKIQITDVEELVIKGKTRVIKGIAVSSKTKKPFDAMLVLLPKGTKDDKGRDVVCKYDFGDKDKTSVQLPEVPDDLKCPYCNGKVVADRFYFRCEHNNKEKQSCGFAVSRHNGKFTTDDLRDLLEKGETRYIENLVSQKGKTFTAAFKLNEKGAKYATEMVFPPKD